MTGMFHVNVCKCMLIPLKPLGECGGCHILPGQGTREPAFPAHTGQLEHIYFPVENNLIAFLRRTQNSRRLFQLTRKIALVIFQVICVFFYIKTSLDVSYMRWFFK